MDGIPGIILTDDVPEIPHTDPLRMVDENLHGGFPDFGPADRRCVSGQCLPVGESPHPRPEMTVGQGERQPRSNEQKEVNAISPDAWRHQYGGEQAAQKAYKRRARPTQDHRVESQDS